VVRLLREHNDPDLKLLVVGHADERGTRTHNQWLSERRARRIARVLTKARVVKRANIEIAGRGETEPMVPRSASRAQQRRNRRVEVMLRCPPSTETP
jgi:outer membrane protein OmpA-like peptidoglycan-associated protein